MDGTTAATTPNGSAISMTRRSLVPGDDADGLHRPDELVDLLRGEQVLLDLVGDDAEAGLLDGQPGECLGLGVAAAAMASTIASIAFLSEFGELQPGLPWRGGQRARLGNRGQIAVGRQLGWPSTMRGTAHASTRYGAFRQDASRPRRAGGE